MSITDNTGKAWYPGFAEADLSHDFNPIAWGTQNPSVTPTPGIVGQWFFQVGTTNVWRKNDAGTSTSWSLVPSSPGSISTQNLGMGAGVLISPLIGTNIQAKSIKNSDYINITFNASEITVSFNYQQYQNDFPNTNAVTSVNGQIGAVVLTKSDIGLSNVPNIDATNRANQFGTQLASTISDFNSAAIAATNQNSIINALIFG